MVISSAAHFIILKGMGPKWKWLGKLFAFFGVGVGLFGIGTFTQINGITSAVKVSLTRIPSGQLTSLEELIPGL